jgi:outer membrane lipoprotein-sorting protein
MHRLLIFICLMLLGFGFAAQGQESLQPIQDKAAFEEKLKSVSKEVQSIESAFIQTKHLSFLEEAIKSQGYFYYQDGNLRWEYQKPFEYLILIKGDKIHLKDENRTNTFDARSNKIFQMVNKIMLSIVRGELTAQEDFEMEYLEGPEEYLVKLSPKQEQVKTMLTSIQLSLDKQEMQVQKCKMVEASGDYTLIEFNERKLNVKIPNEIFTLN